MFCTLIRRSAPVVAGAAALLATVSMAEPVVACGAHYEAPPAPAPQPKGPAGAAATVTAPAQAAGAGERVADGARWRGQVSTRGSVQQTRFGAPGETQIRVADRRVELGGGVVAPQGWHAEVAVPVVHREASFVNGGVEAATSVGDLGLGVGRWWALPSLDVGVHGGVVAPTAPTLRDDEGVALSEDAQPGGGAWAPWVGTGARGTLRRGHWHADSVAFVPAASRFGLRTGASVEVTGGGAWSPARPIALGAAASVRGAQADRYGDARDPNSGGTLVQLSPSLSVTPVSPVQVTVGADVPVYDGLRGHQWVGPRWTLGVTWSS